MGRNRGGTNLRRRVVDAGRLPTPQEALDAYHAQRDVPKGVVEAERLKERLREQGWSEDTIRDHGKDDAAHPLCGAVDAYYAGSLEPARVEYLHTESTACRPGLTAAQVRFPWWRSGTSD